MRKRIILIAAIFVIALSATSQASSGIKFFKGTFAEAVAKAKKEKKQIFIDFYTEWCGPCLTMAENIFILPEVGEVYNNDFINLKIDAEKGEGKELAKKYGVRSFPTYIFINPKTQEISHRSGGNKPKEDFIADTKGALNKKLSSIYLNEKYKKGGFDREFLVSYIQFKKSSGARSEAEKLFNELIATGAKLTEPETWGLFNDCISGYDNPYLMEVSNNYEKFVSIFGKKAVDAKLKALTAYCPYEMYDKLCDFEGKELNKALREFSISNQAKDYTKSAELMDKILANDNFDKEEVIHSLTFSARISPRYTTDETPYEWIVKQVEYLRYIAYNTYNRDDAMIHFNYATGLEYLIARSIREGKEFPKHLLEAPQFGKSIYDTRPAKLKQKPKRKRK